MTKQKSKCCGANLRVGGDDKEGTHYYVCEKCGEPTDVEVDPVRHKQKEEWEINFNPLKFQDCESGRYYTNIEKLKDFLRQELAKAREAGRKEHLMALDIKMLKEMKESREWAKEQLEAIEQAREEAIRSVLPEIDKETKSPILNSPSTWRDGWNTCREEIIKRAKKLGIIIK
jgi:hypothetical protein